MLGMTDEPTQAEVRTWAKEQGIDVPARGRIADDVVARYVSARNGEAGSDDQPADEVENVDDVDDVDAVIKPSVAQAARERAELHYDEPPMNVDVTTLSLGFRHSQRATGVIEVQQRLVNRGYAAGPVDGNPHDATYAAYAQFQQDLINDENAAIMADGEPGRYSLEKLGFRVAD
jgi:hypothetical protein